MITMDFSTVPNIGTPSTNNSLILETINTSILYNDVEFNIDGNTAISSGKFLFSYNGQTLKQGDDYIITDYANGGITPKFTIPKNSNLIFTLL